MNLKELKDILQILEEKEITEFELEEEGMRLRIRKAAGASSNHSEPPSPAPAPATAAALPQASAGVPAPISPPPPPESPVEEGIDLVKSPIVGTFYRGPDPASPPFVNVGDRVRVGQVLCIIEAMKLMNEIEAEADGTVVACMVENAQPVEYGQALFKLAPSS